MQRVAVLYVYIYIYTRLPFPQKTLKGVHTFVDSRHGACVAVRRNVLQCHMYIFTCIRLLLSQKTMTGVPSIRSWIGDMVRVLQWIAMYRSVIGIYICTGLPFPQKTLKGVPTIRSWIGACVAVHHNGLQCHMYICICIYVYMCCMYICICTRLPFPQKTLKGVPSIRSWIGDMVRVLLASVSPPMGCEITITSVLQCVAVCCSGLRCVAVCCSMLQCVAVCCSELQCVAVRSGVLSRVAVCYSVMRCDVFFPLHKNRSIFALQKKSYAGPMQYSTYI